MSRREHDVGGDAGLVGTEPIDRGHAPAVAGHQAGEAVLRGGCAEIVADFLLVFQKLSRDHRTDRVASAVVRTGPATPVAIEAGERVGAAALELLAEHIAVGHRTKYA